MPVDSIGEMKVLRSTVRDQAVEKLRSAIIAGHLRPGQRLVEKDLCDMIGVSRTSLREALRQLQGEKLIHSPAHKGPSVAMLSAEEAAQIYELRAVLERLAGARAAEYATRDHIDRLRRSVDEFGNAVSSDDQASLVRLANNFYGILLEASGSQVLADMLNSLNARISFLRATSMSAAGRAPNSLIEMLAIAKAVARKDPAAAGEACARHVGLAAQVGLKRLSEKNSHSPAAKSAARKKKT